MAPPLMPDMLHLVVVHGPVVLFPLAAAFILLRGRVAWAGPAVGPLLTIATASGIIAALTGLVEGGAALEFRQGSEVGDWLVTHRLLGILTAVTGILAWTCWFVTRQRRDGAPYQLLVPGLAVLAAVLVLATGWYGGSAAHEGPSGFGPGGGGFGNGDVPGGRGNGTFGGRPPPPDTASVAVPSGAAAALAAPKRRLAGRRPDAGAGPADDVVLELRDVRKIYRLGDVEVAALDGVNLRIQRGEYVAIIGPSGSGKSTLLNLMGALDKPTSGEILIDGQPTHRLSSNRIAHVRGSRIGFVFQSFHLHPNLNALENVELPMATLGLPRKGRRERAIELLRRVNMTQRGLHMPNQLSGGQRQRVAIARALANDPAYLLADEPTGNLDSRSGAELLSLLRELHAAGSTILVVTHDDAVAGEADRVITIIDGKIKKEE